MRDHAKASPANPLGALAATRQRWFAGTRLRVYLGLASLLATVVLGGAAAPAQGAVTHVLAGSFPVPFPLQIAVDEGTGQVYVFIAFGDNGYSEPAVARFDAEGNPSNFSALGKNEVDGCCLGTDEADFAPSNGIAGSIASSNPPGQIAVDSSPGLTQHYLMVPFDFGGLIVFNSAGEWVHTVESNEAAGCGISIDPSGSLYIAHEGSSYTHNVNGIFSTSSTVDKFSPGPNTPPQRLSSNSHLYPREEGVCNVAANSSGGTYVNRTQLVPLLSEGEDTPLEYYAPNLFDVILEDKFRGYLGVLGKRISDHSGTFAVDAETDDVYVTQGPEIARYDSEGDLIETFGRGDMASPAGIGIAVNGSTGTIYRSDLFGFQVQVYEPVITPDIEDVAAAAGQTGATITAHIAPAGAPTVTECALEYGPTDEYGSSVPCPGTPFGSGTDISVGISGLETETTYHYRISAANGNGVHRGVDHTFTTHAVADVTTEGPTDVTHSSATLNGSFTGNEESTTTFFEWGPTAEYGASTPEVAGSGTGHTPVSAALTGLDLYTATSGTYHFRFVAKNSVGTTYGPDVEFHTLPPEPPEISAVTAESVSGSGATLTARVRPNLADTGVLFEYGPSSEYGSTVEVTEALAPDEGTHTASVGLSGLTPGLTYHFRAVASNFGGTAKGDDEAFNTPAAPVVEGEAVSAVTQTGATIAAKVKAGFESTSYHFEYGPTPAYGLTAGAGQLGGIDNVDHEVATPISGLSPGTTYHFHVVASNAEGTRVGGDQEFTTRSVAPQQAVVQPPKKCKKRFVKRRGKCVLRKRHKRRRHHRAGSRNHG